MAYTTTQSSPGLLDTLRNTWGSRGNAKPALGLDLDRSFEELQRPKKGFLRSVVASFCLAPAVHGERTPKLDGLTDNEEDADSEATTEVAPPLSLRYTGLGQPWNSKREEAFRARLDKCRRSGAVLVLLRYRPASSHRARIQKKDHHASSLAETITERRLATHTNAHNTRNRRRCKLAWHGVVGDPVEPLIFCGAFPFLALTTYLGWKAFTARPDEGSDSGLSYGS